MANLTKIKQKFISFGSFKIFILYMLFQIVF